MEAAAKMIVHSAGRHLAQREQIHLQRVLTVYGFVSVARINPKKKIERDRSRKFRRAAETALTRVIRPRRLLIAPQPKSSRSSLSFASGRAAGSLAQRRHNFCTLLGNFRVILFPRRRDSLQHFWKARLTVAIFRRKIGSTDKWLADPASATHSSASRRRRSWPAQTSCKRDRHRAVLRDRL